jgi:hypothetical protein
MSAALTWYDRDVAPYNAGTAYYRLAQWDASVDQLERALKHAPDSRQCRVRWNLTLALNQRGDARARSTQENSAIGDYTRAVTLLSYEACADNPNFKTMRESIEQKLEALIERINQQNSRPQSSTPQPSNDPPKTDEEQNAEQTKRQVEYRNSINNNRYYEQTDEQRTQGYQNKAW